VKSSLAIWKPLFVVHPRPHVLHGFGCAILFGKVDMVFKGRIMARALQVERFASSAARLEHLCEVFGVQILDDGLHVHARLLLFLGFGSSIATGSFRLLSTPFQV
jgi:hypothetical protein